MYKKSEELRQLADKVMDKYEDVSHLKELGCNILFLACDKEKSSKASKRVYADTEKVKDKYKSVMIYDFIITFYTSLTDELDDKQMEILMWHELKHVGFDDEGNCKVIPHDVEDFMDVVKRYGPDWVESYKSL